MEDNAAYFSARISAMKEKLFPMLTYEKMLLMELPEITRYISEGDYHEDVTELSKSFKGIDLIEYALNLNLARTYQKLLNISEGKIHKFITQYMKRWDIENVKSILRGLSSGVSSQEMVETLIPVGSLKFSYLISLSKMDYKSAKEDLESKKIIPPEYESIPDLENEIDKRYFQESIMVANEIGEEGIIEYLYKEVDLHNLKILLRLKNEGTDFELIKEELIPLGKRITKRSYKSLEEMDFEGTVKFANKQFSNLRLDPGENITIIEQELDKYLIAFGERVSHLNMFSSLMALGFILRKYREIANLRLIVRGKQLGLPPESIEKMLVV